MVLYFIFISTFLNYKGPDTKANAIKTPIPGALAVTQNHFFPKERTRNALGLRQNKTKQKQKEGTISESPWDAIKAKNKGTAWVLEPQSRGSESQEEILRAKDSACGVLQDRCIRLQQHGEPTGEKSQARQLIPTIPVLRWDIRILSSRPTWGYSQLKVILSHTVRHYFKTKK